MTSSQPAEKPQVLALTALPPPLVKALQKNFALSQLDTKNSANWLAKHGKQFTGAVTHAGAGISAEIVKALPQLKVVSSLDRKSTRLNSSHVAISYAVFCLKKKKKNTYTS